MQWLVHSREGVNRVFFAYPPCWLTALPFFQAREAGSGQARAILDDVKTTAFSVNRVCRQNKVAQ